MFGSVPQNLPQPLQDALRYFSSKFQTDRHTSQFPAILHMSIQYKIHWISMWSYVINQNLLDREFFTKWWDRFRPTDIYLQALQGLSSSSAETHSSLHKITIEPRLRSDIRKVYQRTQRSCPTATPPVRTARVRRKNLSCLIWSFLQSCPGWPISGYPRSLRWLQLGQWLWTLRAPEQLSESIVCSTVHLCIIWLLFRTVPALAELTDKATITIPEKQGDKTLFINSDQLLFTPTVPQTESWSYYLLSADKTIHPK